MPIPFFQRIFALAAIALSSSWLGCETDDGVVGEELPIEGLGNLCNVGDTPRCPSGMTCSHYPALEDSCVYDGCPTNGPGLEHGCPIGAFCYVYDGNDGHQCTRVCERDDDCQAGGNASLHCRSEPESEGFGLKICVYVGSAED